MQTSDKTRTHDSDSDEWAKSSESVSGTQAPADKSTQMVNGKKQHESTQVEQIETARIQQELGGFENAKEPTRYGDWEIAGRCVDF